MPQYLPSLSVVWGRGFGALLWRGVAAQAQVGKVAVGLGDADAHRQIAQRWCQLQLGLLVVIVVAPRQALQFECADAAGGQVQHLFALKRKRPNVG